MFAAPGDGRSFVHKDWSFEAQCHSKHLRALQRLIIRDKRVYCHHYYRLTDEAGIVTLWNHTSPVQARTCRLLSHLMYFKGMEMLYEAVYDTRFIDQTIMRQLLQEC